MKKMFGIISVVLLLIVMTGCSKEINITLMVDGEEYHVFSEVDKDTILSLDVLEPEEGMIFTGWRDGDVFYYDSIEAKESLTLDAMFEVIDEVFIYEYVPFYDGNNITDYLGDGGFVTIPQTLGEDSVITGITTESFKDSNLYKVFIPIEANVSQEAFTGNDKLTEIEYYGDFLRNLDVSLGNHEYETIIEENNCYITEVTIESQHFTLNEGCPIIEVLSKTDSIFIQDVEYFSYSATVDQNQYTKGFRSTFSINSFKGIDNLKVIKISKGETFISSLSFYDLDQLEAIIVHEDNPNYTSVDGVLYTKDMENLVYYPQNKSESTFEIMDSLDYVFYDAFENNKHIKTIILSEHFEGEFGSFDLPNLETIIVESGNDKYRVEDGVLFSETTLIKYPAKLPNQSYTVPEGITMIADGAFAYVVMLDELTMSDTVEYIGDYVFRGTESLEVLTLSESVEFVGRGILHESSVKELHVLREYEEGELLTTLISTLGEINEDLLIYFPEGSAQRYALENYWRNYLEYFEYYKE